MIWSGEQWVVVGCCKFLFFCSPVLPVDRWTECASGPRDGQRMDSEWPGYLAIYGAQAATAGPGEHPNPRCPPSYSKAPQQFKLLLWFHPYGTLRAFSFQHIPAPFGLCAQPRHFSISLSMYSQSSKSGFGGLGTYCWPVYSLNPLLNIDSLLCSWVSANHKFAIICQVWNYG